MRRRITGVGEPQPTTDEASVETDMRSTRIYHEADPLAIAVFPFGTGIFDLQHAALGRQIAEELAEMLSRSPRLIAMPRVLVSSQESELRDDLLRCVHILPTTAFAKLPRSGAVYCPDPPVNPRRLSNARKGAYSGCRRSARVHQWRASSRRPISS